MEGTSTSCNDDGDVHTLVGSVPSMNCRVWMFWGSVNGFGRQFGSWEASTETETNPTSGFGNAITGRPRIASSISRRQICAGHVPP